MADEEQGSLEQGELAQEIARALHDLKQLLDDRNPPPLYLAATRGRLTALLAELGRRRPKDLPPQLVSLIGEANALLHAVSKVRMSYKLNRLIVGLLVGMFLAASVLLSVFVLAAVVSRTSLATVMATLESQRGTTLFYVCVLLSGLLGGNIATKALYFFLGRGGSGAALEKATSHQPMG